VRDDIAALALAVAHAAGLGYSAQDWIRDGEGRWWFVDLNSVSEEFDLESTDGPCVGSEHRRRAVGPEWLAIPILVVAHIALGVVMAAQERAGTRRVRLLGGTLDCKIVAVAIGQTEYVRGSETYRYSGTGHSIGDQPVRESFHLADSDRAEDA